MGEKKGRESVPKPAKKSTSYLKHPIKEFKTRRDDAKRDRNITYCPNSTFVGYSSVRLRYGDMFVYKYANDGQAFYALCHGRIMPGGFMGRADGKKEPYILAEVLSVNGQFTYERWVDAEEVVEIIPHERVHPGWWGIWGVERDV